MKDQLKNNLDREIEEKKLLEKGSQLMVVCISCVALLLVFSWLDYSYIFSVEMRWIGWSALFAVSIWRVVEYLKAYLRVISLRDIAAEIETKAGPNKKCVLSTAADRIPRKGNRSQVESELEKNLYNTAHEIVEESPQRSRKQVYICVAATLSVLILASSFAALYGLISFRRILAPWIAENYTQVELIPISKKVFKYDPVSIAGAITGRNPEQATAYLSNGKELDLSISNEGKFMVDLPNGVDGPTEIWVKAGDGESEKILIDLYDVPEIETLKIEVSPPSYASRLRRTEERLSFAVLRASELSYELRFNQDVKKVILIPDSDTTEDQAGAIDFTADSADASIFRAIIPIGSEDLVYRLQIESLKGKKFLDDEPHRITSLPDQKPIVRIANVKVNDVQIGNEPLQLRVKVADDVEAQKIMLSFRKVGGSDKNDYIPIRSDTPWEFSEDAVIELSKLDLEPEDLVIIKATVWDGNTLDGPGIGVSELFFLEIPKEETLADNSANQANDRPPSSGAGNEKGGKIEVINPLELQKKIFKDSMKLSSGSEKRRWSALKEDQQENAQFTKDLSEILALKIKDKQPLEYVDRAAQFMDRASISLGENDRASSLEFEEYALRELIEARKLLLEEPGAT